MNYFVNKVNSKLVYTFEVSEKEIAECDFSASTLELIMKLEKTPNIAHQLEVLLEYFHAIEGTDRITELALYMKYIEATHKYNMQTEFVNTSTTYIGPNLNLASSFLKNCINGHKNISTARFCTICNVRTFVTI